MKICFLLKEDKNCVGFVDKIVLERETLEDSSFIKKDGKTYQIYIYPQPAEKEVYDGADYFSYAALVKEDKT